MVQNAGLLMLRSFQQQNSRTFVELCKEAGYPTDLGGYYLRQLLNSQYLEKGKRGEYLLAAKGRQYLATTKDKPKTAPRPHILVVPTVGKNFVAIERSAQPFLKRKEWPATLIHSGEAKDEAVHRLLAKQLTQTDNITYCGVFRRLDYYEDQLFDDKLFFVHKVDLQDIPTPNDAKHKIVQINEGEIERLQNKSRSLLDILHFVNSGKSYQEQKYTLEYDDFEPTS